MARRASPTDRSTEADVIATASGGSAGTRMSRYRAASTAARPVAPSRLRNVGIASQMPKLSTLAAMNVSTCALSDSLRPRMRRPAPSAGATSEVAAIDRPMPIDTVRNTMEPA